MKHPNIRGARGKVLAWLSAGVMAISPLLGLPLPVGAGANPPIVVNSTLDSDDGCTGECSLRDAINAANANAGPDTIEFNIGGGGVLAAIQPAAQLPDITSPLTIDGYSQGGTANTNATGPLNGTLLIVINGVNLGNVLTIQSSAPGSVIRGLVMTNATATAIFVDADNVAIEGNYIGTNAAGAAVAGNNRGVLIDDSVGARIGGDQPEQRNLISASAFQGIEVAGSATETVIQGNLIGTAKNGTSNLGNGIGVQVSSSAKRTTIGGAGAAGNVIAFSNTDGVIIANNLNTGNRILGNSIFANGFFGIDLGDDGPTLNDKKDPDSGANRLQNFPLLTSAVIDGATTTIKGKLNSTPNTKFTVQIFASPFSLVDFEGKVFLGQKTITTDKKGNAKFTITTDVAVNVGDLITTTATNKKKGNTSEFSTPEAAANA